MFNVLNRNEYGSRLLINYSSTSGEENPLLLNDIFSTNKPILKNWLFKTVVIDTLWGAVLFSLSVFIYRGVFKGTCHIVMENSGDVIARCLSQSFVPSFGLL